MWLDHGSCLGDGSHLEGQNALAPYGLAPYGRLPLKMAAVTMAKVNHQHALVTGFLSFRTNLQTVFGDDSEEEEVCFISQCCGKCSCFGHLFIAKFFVISIKIQS